MTHDDDRSLLARFAATGDADAFDHLVRRHGAMVLGVCRRVLRHAHDAEDACQATFLALARRPAAVRGSVGGWLHAVAWRAARRLRAAAARGTRPLQNLAEIAAPEAADLSGRELRAVLDEELDRLPETYRAPLVLCYLEGLTQDEAAQRLGWTAGALRGRLDRGRARLRSRLARRGFGLSTVLFAAALSAPAASAFAPILSGAATPRVETLALEVLRSMTPNRRKATLALLLLLGVGGGLTGLIGGNAAAPPRDAVPHKPQTAPAPKVVPQLKDIAEVVEPEDTFVFRTGQTRLVAFKKPPRLFAVSNDAVLGQVNISTTQYSFAGLKPGLATIYLWFDDPGAERDKVWGVNVIVDPADNATAKDALGSKAYRKFVERIVDAKDTLTLFRGQSRLVLFAEKPFRVQVFDGRVLDYTVAKGEANSFLIHGKGVGATVMTLWFGDKDDVSKQKVLSLVVQVKEGGGN